MGRRPLIVTQEDEMRRNDDHVFVVTLPGGATRCPPAPRRRTLSSRSAAPPTPSGCGATSATTGRSTTSPPFPARATATTGRARRSSCCSRPGCPRRSTSRPACTAGSARTSGPTSAASAAASTPTTTATPGPCVGGDCGEFDPRSNQYVKLRGVTVTLTPGYTWIDSATIGANDWGMFDPFVIGRIRYIDRDNGSGLLFQGSGVRPQVHLGRGAHLAAAALGRPELFHRQLSMSRTPPTVSRPRSRRARRSTSA